ncbi:MAG: aspartate-semialdehyde dehydrogenase, partial [Myxococcales bacterium]|nr:aspartate-semialdehyde dehydrogenase [Myxococcales bacterium]
MNRRYTVAVVGATGLVGAEMLRVLEERDFPIGELRPLASERSTGRRVRFAGQEHEVRATGPKAFEGVDLALFSAGSGPAREFCP